MDLRLDIERRKRFAGKDRGRSPGGSRGPSRERSSEKSGKHHKKSKYVPPPPSEHRWFPHWARSNNFSHPPSVCPYRKSKKKRDRSPSSSSSSSSPSPYPPSFRGKDYMGEGMEHPEEGYNHPRFPPRDYGGPADRGPRDYEGHNPERGRGRGFVSPSSSPPCTPPVLPAVFAYLFPLSDILTSPLLALTESQSALLLCSVPSP